MAERAQGEAGIRYLAAGAKRDHGRQPFKQDIVVGKGDARSVDGHPRAVTSLGRGGAVETDGRLVGAEGEHLGAVAAEARLQGLRQQHQAVRQREATVIARTEHEAGVGQFDAQGFGKAHRLAVTQGLGGDGADADEPRLDLAAGEVKTDGQAGADLARAHLAGHRKPELNLHIAARLHFARPDESGAGHPRLGDALAGDGEVAKRQGKAPDIGLLDRHVLTEGQIAGDGGADLGACLGGEIGRGLDIDFGPAGGGLET